MLPPNEKPRELPERPAESHEVQRQAGQRIEGIRERTLGSILAVLQAEKVKVDGQTIEYIDLPAEGKEKKSEVPLVIVPGWSETSLSFAPMMVDFHRRGRRVFSVCNTHGIDTPRISGYPMPQLRKAMALIKCLEAKGIKHVDAVGRSEGAVVTTIAAHLRPGLFRNIVLFNPAGILKNENLLRLGYGALRNTLDKTKQHKELDSRNGRTRFQKDYDRFTGGEAIKYWRSGLWHSAKEVWSLSNTNMSKELRDIQSGTRGPAAKVALLASNQDKFFPFPQKKRPEVSARTGIPLHRFLDIKGHHWPHLLDDQNVTATIERALTLMETERNGESEPAK